MPVDHHRLLHLEDLHIPRQGRKGEAHDQPPEDHHMLDGEEHQRFVGVARPVEGVRREDDDARVGHHGEHPEDVKGGVPRLVVRRRHRERPAVQQHELLLVQETLQHAAEQRHHGHPWASHDEQRGVPVKDEDLVHVFVHVVILLLALPLRLGEVRHDGQRRGVKERRVEGALLPELADLGREPREPQLQQVLERQSHAHENRQLGAQILQAVAAIGALHRHGEQRLLVLEESDVVQRHVAVHEFEHHRLR
mmetsp:Transcript_105024/g.321849  ORF Transcript_105024/g.321849 Transcript_105024/m.321849 type:complete len:251 (+) Transcript_105024:198-950(+)